jgi:hypothetical protein
MEMRMAEIFEVEYSVSPGGVDCWEMEVRTGVGQHSNYSEYKSAGEALNHLLSLYPDEQLNVTITNLNAYNKLMDAGVYA